MRSMVPSPTIGSRGSWWGSLARPPYKCRDRPGARSGYARHALGHRPAGRAALAAWLGGCFSAKDRRQNGPPAGPAAGRVEDRTRDAAGRSRRRPASRLERFAGGRCRRRRRKGRPAGRSAVVGRARAAPAWGDQREAADPGANLRRNWELRFAKGTTKENYARQLDFFGIELAVVMPENKLLYVRNFSKGKPETRTGAADRETRCYLTWSEGDLSRADADLLARAGVSTERSNRLENPPAGGRGQAGRVGKGLCRRRHRQRSQDPLRHPRRRRWIRVLRDRAVSGRSGRKSERPAECPCRRDDGRRLFSTSSKRRTSCPRPPWPPCANRSPSPRSRIPARRVAKLLVDKQMLDPRDGPAIARRRGQAGAKQPPPAAGRRRARQPEAPRRTRPPAAGRGRPGMASLLDEELPPLPADLPPWLRNARRGPPPARWTPCMSDPGLVWRRRNGKSARLPLAPKKTSFQSLVWQLRHRRRPSAAETALDLGRHRRGRLARCRRYRRLGRQPAESGRVARTGRRPLSRRLARRGDPGVQRLLGAISQARGLRRARVRRGLAQLRLSSPRPAGESAPWRRPEPSCPRSAAEAEFDEEAGPVLAALLPQVAERLASQARQRLTPGVDRRGPGHVVAGRAVHPRRGQAAGATRPHRGLAGIDAAQDRRRRRVRQGDRRDRAGRGGKGFHGGVSSPHGLARRLSQPVQRRRPGRRRPRRHRGGAGGRGLGRQAGAGGSNAPPAGPLSTAICRPAQVPRRRPGRRGSRGLCGRGRRSLRTGCRQRQGAVAEIRRLESPAARRRGRALCAGAATRQRRGPGRRLAPRDPAGGSGHGPNPLATRDRQDFSADPVVAEARARGHAQRAAA